jgi:acyl carrier protein
MEAQHSSLGPDVGSTLSLLQDRIRAYITQAFVLGGDETNLELETPFIESGLIDSLGVVEIAEFLETEFGIEIDDEEISPENMNSIGRLARFVEQKSTDL